MLENKQSRLKFSEPLENLNLARTLQSQSSEFPPPPPPKKKALVRAALEIVTQASKFHSHREILRTVHSL